ncbi:TonB-dependent receptor [Chitinophaga pendula]|uniref:SusC/RagA family TonB-linked outer membrane protein n=1 Tax=Chitinophaga TaxID=79328 RepID=UPI000BAFEBD0|nr:MULTISPECIES: TonB-dependent receptor [Chitinophaga]ASZ14822.1 SusC/RagA family TonB-linked outer membrane protein [Chitinophaga sp. MD30]UCJ06536.1 TonB-dependent receptor [Chitinophaga pendula]
MRRFYSLLTLVLLCLTFFTAAMAQNKTLTGKVTDAKDGAVLPGVTVKVKGSNLGTVTKIDGTFSVPVPERATALIFSFVGYGDKEVSIVGQTNLNVSLSTGDKDLSEVVVVGYGTQTKRDITGSVAKVTTKDIANQPVATFESSIQGRAAGVVIESGSGKVGQAMKIRIRGTSSVSASSQPLYVVDGMPIISASQSDVTNDPTNPIADLNPNDIESVEVLKDAAASAIYGARASNGVVLITTKRGKLGDKTNIELNVSTSFSKPTRKRGFLNANEYLDLVKEVATNDGRTDFKNNDTGYPDEATAINDYYNYYVDNYITPFAAGTDWQKRAVNTNWEDQVYRKTAHTRQIDLAVSGGNEKTRYYASGTYADQEAIVIVNRFRRYGARLNLDHNANSKLSFGLNLNVNRQQLDRVANDNALSTPGQIVALQPFSPIIDPATNDLNLNTLYANGLLAARESFNKQVGIRTIGNVYANYYILPSLSFRTELGTDIYNLDEEDYRGRNTQDGAGIGKGSYIHSQNVSLNSNNYFNFNPNLGSRHKLTATLGMSYLQNDFTGSLVSGENFPSDAIKNLSGAATISDGSSSSQRYTFLSYFFRSTYTYKDKYMASFSVRTDGSSRFGPNNRYGWFPAGSLGWVISEEDFLKGSKTLNYLKIRGSYGLTGNAEIGENRIYTLMDVVRYPGLPGFQPVQIGNPNLKWERTAQADIGLEFGFFDNRLSGEIDYYNKQTSDLLLRANVPLSTGYGFVYRNVGKMENKGVEILLNSKNIVGKDFTWSTSLNVAYNKNRVKDLQGQIIDAGEQRAIEGQPIGVFFLRKFVGVDPANGDALYEGADGKPTNNYGAAPRQIVGRSNPDWTGGFNNTFSYQGIDLSVFFTFVQGNQVYNRAGQYMSSGFGGGFDNQTRDILNRWQKPGDITDVPRVSSSYATGNQTSSRWIYDGSYIRLKTLTLGYNLPKSVLNTIKFSGVRIYVAGYNLWTKTKYPGDPEVNTGTLGNVASDNIVGGVDFYTIPQAKTFTVGLNVKF